jgi:hypothetical protein
MYNEGKLPWLHIESRRYACSLSNDVECVADSHEEKIA